MNIDDWRPGVLADWQLMQLCATAYQLVDKYDIDLVNPASIDLRLSTEFVNLHTGVKFASPILEIEPGDAILASTIEYVRIPDWCCATLYLKSSAARRGLDHALAGWIDPGFHGQLTLELHAHRPVTIEAGKCYVQMVVMKMSAPPERSYQQTGRYNGQRGPTEAR